MTHPPKLTDTAIERLRAVADALLQAQHDDAQFVRGVRSAAHRMLTIGGWDTERAYHIIDALTPNVEVTGAARLHRAASRERSERGRPPGVRPAWARCNGVEVPCGSTDMDA